MTLGPWFYIAGGAILMLAAPRFGAFLYQRKRWPNPIERRRQAPGAVQSRDYRRGLRKQQAVFLLLGAGLLIVGLMKILSGDGAD